MPLPLLGGRQRQPPTPLWVTPQAYVELLPVAALGGMEIVFNEITALNPTPADAHRATVGLDKAIRALTRIKSLI